MPEPIPAAPEGGSPIEGIDQLEFHMVTGSPSTPPPEWQSGESLPTRGNRTRAATDTYPSTNWPDGLPTDPRMSPYGPPRWPVW